MILNSILNKMVQWYYLSEIESVKQNVVQLEIPLAINNLHRFEQNVTKNTAVVLGIKNILNQRIKDSDMDRGDYATRMDR